MLRSLLKYLSTHPSMALEVSLQMVPTSSPTGAKLYSTRAPSKLSLRPVVETPVDSENSPGYRPVTDIAIVACSSNGWLRPERFQNRCPSARFVVACNPKHLSECRHALPVGPVDAPRRVLYILC